MPGRVRLTLSDHALETVVWPKLKPLLAAHPDISVEFSIDNMFRNIVAVGNDALPRGAKLCGSVLIERMMVAGS